MTKKNAKKSAARARKEQLGGNYQAHLRQVGGADGERGDDSRQVTKYLHIEYGTPDGTVWLLSDEPRGAALCISVPDGPLTQSAAEAAFARTVYPLINETSDDGGRTWVQHLEVEPQREWLLARRLIYSLLGSGGGRWNAARIRARTGEDLVRHPPRLLQDVASQIQAAFKDAQLTLQPPNDQLFVRTGTRMFALATSMKRASDWPIYVTPIPPPSETDRSWECFTIDDVMDALRWPAGQPTVRVASVDDIRAGEIKAPPLALNVWSREMVIVVAGETADDAAGEQERVARHYPKFPWLGQESKVWRKLGATESLTICDPSEPVTRTAEAWARLRGRGLLAVPDYTTGQPGPWRGPEWLRTYTAPVKN